MTLPHTPGAFTPPPSAARSPPGSSTGLRRIASMLRDTVSEQPFPGPGLRSARRRLLR